MKILQQQLLAYMTQWRRAAEQGRVHADETDHLLVRGHIYGMSDGLDLAAEDVAKALQEFDLRNPVLPL
jgi:hypothetical protein